MPACYQNDSRQGPHLDYLNGYRRETFAKNSGGDSENSRSTCRDHLPHPIIVGEFPRFPFCTLRGTPLVPETPSPRGKSFRKPGPLRRFLFFFLPLSFSLCLASPFLDLPAPSRPTVPHPAGHACHSLEERISFFAPRTMLEPSLERVPRCIPPTTLALPFRCRLACSSRLVLSHLILCSPWRCGDLPRGMTGTTLIPARSQRCRSQAAKPGRVSDDIPVPPLPPLPTRIASPVAYVEYLQPQYPECQSNANPMPSGCPAWLRRNESTTAFIMCKLSDLAAHREPAR